MIVYLKMKPETREQLQAGTLSPALALLKRFIENPEERVRFKVSYAGMYVSMHYTLYMYMLI